LHPRILTLLAGYAALLTELLKIGTGDVISLVGIGQFIHVADFAIRRRKQERYFGRSTTALGCPLVKSVEVIDFLTAGGDNQ
jgi:hypothetical protein